MKRTLLVLSLLALLFIVVDAVLRATITSNLQANGFNFWLRYTAVLNERTAYVLAPATGVVALVAAAQRHQRGWFAGVFVLLFAGVYGLYVVYLPLPYVNLSALLLDTVQAAVFMEVLLAVTPLATLVYSLVGTEAKPPAAE